MKTNFKKASLWRCLALALFSLTLVGCPSGPDEGETVSSIEVSVESISLEQAKGAKTTFDVTANCDWVISTTASWIQIPSKQGNGNATVNVIAKTANNEIGARTGELTVTSKDGKATKTIAVSQLGLGATVELSAETIELQNAPEAAGGVTVTSNVEWTLSQEGDWFTVETADAGSRTQITATATAYNETLEARTGKIILTYTDGAESKTTEIAVVQAACEPKLVAEPAKVEFMTTEAGETTFVLTAAGTWSLTAPEWATVEPTSGASGETTITVTVGANDAIKERAGVIAITGLGDAAIDVPVAQAGNEPKVSCEENVAVDCSEGTYQLTINANYGWSATTSANWLSLEPSRGEAGETVVTVSFGANTPDDSNDGKERKGDIEITCSASDGTTTIFKSTFTQAAFDGEDLSSVESANSYITTKTGYSYKFKAGVRGNGKADESEYITVLPINLNEAGLEAIELWRDNMNPMLENIRLDKEKGYIMFDVVKDAPIGNTVIALAVMDEFDPTLTTNILWSWHIWVNHEDIESKAMDITYPGTVMPAVPVTLMDRNLGALSNGKSGSDADVHGSYGLHYEWGRKDPFPGCQELISPYRDAEYKSYLSSTRIPLYRTIDGIATDVTAIFQGTGMGQVYELAVNNGEDPDENVTINYSIANPTVYITGGSSDIAYGGAQIHGRPASWLYVPESLRAYEETENGEVYAYGLWSWQTYLWGNSNNAETGANYGTKTIYDPCPPGWRVPDHKTWAFVMTKGAYVNTPLFKDGDDQVKQSINCAEEFVGWTNADDFGSQYKYESEWNKKHSDNKKNECKYEGFNAGYNIYTGGYQTGETMFLPMSGQLSYDSGNPCSDYSGWGSCASYATNAQDNLRAYCSRLEIYAPSAYITERANWDNEYKIHKYPGATGSPNSSFHQATGFSMRCMKDVVPTIEEE